MSKLPLTLCCELSDVHVPFCHLGHPRVTVACQSDSALFALGLSLAKSTPLAARRKVANHSPWTPRGKQTSSMDIWSWGFPFLSNTFTHLHRGHFRYACTWGIGHLRITLHDYHTVHVHVQCMIHVYLYTNILHTLLNVTKCNQVKINHHVIVILLTL
jgi:hypothetical protein